LWLLLGSWCEVRGVSPPSPRFGRKVFGRWWLSSCLGACWRVLLK
jgi:hypothetical protein